MDLGSVSRALGVSGHPWVRKKEERMGRMECLRMCWQCLQGVSSLDDRMEPHLTEEKAGVQEMAAHPGWPGQELAEAGCGAAMCHCIYSASLSRGPSRKEAACLRN